MHAKIEPSDADIADAARVLAQLEPGFLPLPLFLQITRLAVTPIVEVVPLRMRGGKVEVLLTKREDTDPTWPGMLHTPGTVLRATDEPDSYASAFARIDDELGGATLAGKPQYVTSILHKGRRGMENASVFFVEVVGDPVIGAFHDAAVLPKNVVDSQIDFIKTAVDAFRKTRA